MPCSPEEPLAKAAEVGGLCATAKGLRLVGGLTEAALGMNSAKDGFYAIQRGDGLAAAGYFGDAFLRLLGASNDLIKGLKVPACFIAGTPVLVPGPADPPSQVSKSGLRIHACEQQLAVCCRDVCVGLAVLDLRRRKDDDDEEEPEQERHPDIAASQIRTGPGPDAEPSKMDEGRAIAVQTPDWRLKPHLSI